MFSYASVIDLVGGTLMEEITIGENRKFEGCALLPEGAFPSGMKGGSGSGPPAKRGSSGLFSCCGRTESVDEEAEANLKKKYVNPMAPEAGDDEEGETEETNASEGRPRKDTSNPAVACD